MRRLHGSSLMEVKLMCFILLVWVRMVEVGFEAVV